MDLLLSEGFSYLVGDCVAGFDYYVDDPGFVVVLFEGDVLLGHWLLLCFYCFCGLDAGLSVYGEQSDLEYFIVAVMDFESSD